MQSKSILLGSTCGLAALLFAQGACARAETTASAVSTATAVSTAAEPEASGSVGEVVVTARRRAEDVQKTPISVSAISGEQLRSAAVKNVQDLTSLVPGVNFTGSGSRVNTVFSIRGLSRGVVGNAQPAVATYINEVPTSTWAASLPTYDLASVQVVKGPQGTLFGRNTTAGAILATTKTPTYDFGAYGEATLGSYDWRQFDGAVNVPIVTDKVALRVAANIVRRDGYTKNMSFPGEDFDQQHQNNFRVSLLLEPVDGLRNLFVFDSTEARDNGSGLVFYRYTPGGTVDNPALVWINGGLLSLSPMAPCGGRPICDVRAAQARQAAAGSRKAWDDLTPLSRIHTRSFINTTSYELGQVTLKNIFGYRTVHALTNSNTDGYEASLVNAVSLVDIKQVSDEFQVSGKSFDDKLTWIAGLFYLKAQPKGPNRLMIQTFAAPGLPVTFPGTTVPFTGAKGNADFYTDTSKAVFGQINYDLTGLSASLRGLSVDIGLRYTKDSSRVCSIVGQRQVDPLLSASSCPAANSAAASSSKVTYTAGLNYQATDDVLVYLVTRRGYRSGGVNPPKLGGTLADFQSYKPETVTDVELGLKTRWRFGDARGHFNLAAYNSTYKGLQAGVTTGAANPLAGGPDGDFNSVDDPSNSVFYANVGNGRVRGVEAELGLSPVRGLDLSAGAAWISKKVTKVTVALPSTLNTTFAPSDLESFAFLGAPDYSYTASASYTLPLPGRYGELVFGVKYFKISAVEFGSVTAPSWDKVDLHADWNNIMGSKVDASLFVNNAGNTAAPVAASLSSHGLGVNSVIYNEPRMTGVRLRYAFGGE